MTSLPNKTVLTEINDGTVDENELQRALEKMNKTEKILEISKMVFKRMSEGVWYLIQCSDNEKFDIYNAIGIKYIHLKPFFMELGLFYNYGKQLRINYGGWIMFCRNFEADFGIKLTTMKSGILGSKTRYQYHICLGKSLHVNPNEQQIALDNHSFSLPRESVKNDYISKVVIEIGDVIFQNTGFSRNERNVTNISNCDSTHNVNNTTNTENNNDVDMTSICARVNEDINTIDLNNNSEMSEILERNHHEDILDHNVVAVNNRNLTVDAMINYAANIDMHRRPRYSRDGENQIIIHKRKEANESEKLMMIYTSKILGYDKGYKSKRQKASIADAACKQVSYDAGFETVVGSARSIERWESKIIGSIMSGRGGDLIKSPLKNNRIGSRAKLDIIDKEHPGYLHKLFREVVAIRGPKESFDIIATYMVEKSKGNDDGPEFEMTKYQLINWFHKNGGKEISPIEKPLDTDEHKQTRIEWVRSYYNILTNENYAVGFLDEKWIYTTNRRRRLKHLPKANFEEDGVDKIRYPKILSRRFPVKSMFMGVIANPIKEQNFNGKIFFERISKQETIKQVRCHKNFSHDVHVNEELSRGGWRLLLTDIQSVEEIFNIIEEHYLLDNFIRERLQMVYVTYSAGGQKQKKICRENRIIGEVIQRALIRPQIDAEPRGLTYNDLLLEVKPKENDTREVDASCDSEYMLRTMHKVGRALREAYHFKPVEETIYLVMDNAGGHGKKEAIKEYTKYLKDEYNVQIIPQVPRSPYTNLLDLGVWCSFQARVKKKHHGQRCKVETLVESAYNTWNDESLDDVIGKVYKRLQRVLALIVKGNGSNDLVETHRGKKHENLDLPIDFIEEAVENADVNQAGERIDRLLRTIDDMNDDEEVEEEGGDI